MLDLKKMQQEVQIQSINEIMQCNKVTSNYGIVISQKQALELMKVHQEIIQELGRMSVNYHVIKTLIIAFCNSAFINKYNQQEIFYELIEIFYYYRDALDTFISDEQIVSYMQCAYEGPCQGSLEYLGDAILEKIIDDIMAGKDILEEIQYAYWKD